MNNIVGMEERDIVQYRMRLAAGIAHDKKRIAWRADRADVLGTRWHRARVARLQPLWVEAA